MTVQQSFKFQNINVLTKIVTQVLFTFNKKHFTFHEIIKFITNLIIIT